MRHLYLRYVFPNFQHWDARLQYILFLFTLNSAFESNYYPQVKIEKLLSDLHRKSVLHAFGRIVTVKINVRKTMLINPSQILLPAK